MSGVVKRINQKITKSRKPFNQELIKHYRRRSINGIAEVIGIVYKEACSLFNDHVIFLDYRVLTPEQRIMTELSFKYTEVDINKFEWNLVEYRFRFQDSGETEDFSAYIYIPHLIDDFIVLNNTNNGIFNLLTDRVFAKNDRTVIVKLLRSPLHFFTSLFTALTINTNQSIPVQIPCGRIHNKTPHKTHIPLVLYFICKFGFKQTLEFFGLNEKVLSIVPIDKTTQFDNECVYFSLGKDNNKRAVKVDKNIFFTNTLAKSITISIVKIFNMKSIKINSIPVDELVERNEYWYIFLGKLIYGPKIERAKLYSNMEKHFESLDTYLDPISRSRFNSAGLGVNSVYDIFKFIIENINAINVKYARNDMLLKRFDVYEQILIDVFIRNLFRGIYDYKNRSSQFKKDDIIKLFTFRVRKDCMKSIYDQQNVETSVQNYNDSKLFNYLTKVIKPSATKSPKDDNISIVSKLKFNMSYIFVQSLIGFSTNSPQKTSTLNPFVKIDEYGSFIVTSDFKEYLEKQYTRYFR